VWGPPPWPSRDAPELARRALHTWLMDVTFSERTKYDALVVVSELVTQAVVAARSAPLVDAMFDDGRLRIEVFDTDPSPPAMTSGMNDDRVRMRVIDSLCDGWGWSRTGNGKRVWTDAVLTATGRGRWFRPVSSRS